MAQDLEQEEPVQTHPIEEVRQRSVLFGKYILWALCFGCVLVVGSTYLAIVQRWLALVEVARLAFGIPHPVSGPDWWLCTGLSIALLLPVALVAMLYRIYSNAWKSRLRGIWQTDDIPPHAKVRRLRSVASGADIKSKIDYLRSVSNKPAWRSSNIPDAGETPEGYKRAAEATLAEIEKDISERAITVGLVVGVSRNRAIDLFTIAAAAFELQLHVLTRLGKRPSLAAWRQMMTRTASSLFLNCYLSQNESLWLRVAIKKMGMGLEVAADMIDHATTVVGDHLTGLFEAHNQPQWDSDDADWDDAEHIVPHSVFGIPVKSLVDAVRLTAGTFVGIGTFGIRELGVFIDKAGDELFQGALAGGILYFHGMAIAADCLALDRSHRETAAMNRTVWQCMVVSSTAAGRVLQDSVRELRKALRERRRRVITAAKERTKDLVGKATDEVRADVASAGAALGHALTTAGAQVHDAAKTGGSTLVGIFRHKKDSTNEAQSEDLSAGSASGNEVPTAGGPLHDAPKRTDSAPAVVTECTQASPGELIEHGKGAAQTAAQRVPGLFHRSGG